MRDLTKSMSSYALSSMLFGAQQMSNMLWPSGRGGSGGDGSWQKATAAFDEVTRAAEDQLGDSMRETFKAGDKFLRGFVDMMFGSWLSRPGRAAGQDTCCGWRDTGDAGAPPQDTGWGPMPQDDGDRQWQET
jgi:hypothetical protein